MNYIYPHVFSLFWSQLTREIKEKDASGVWRPLLAYKNMIRAIEHLGISMVFGEQYFGRGDLDQSSYIEFVTNDALGQDFLNSSQNFAYWIKDRYVPRKSHIRYVSMTGLDLNRFKTTRKAGLGEVFI